MRELSLHLLDLAQNSLAAGATRLRIEVRLDTATDRLSLTLEDDGRGIPARMLEKVTDPFVTSRKTRRVGLGLALLKAAAQRAEGDLTIVSHEGQGTRVTATFRAGHLDRAPLGDLAGTIVSLLACNPHLELELVATWDGGTFNFSTAAWRETQGGGSGLDTAVFAVLHRHLATGLAPLRAAEEAAMGPSRRDGAHA
ncbi:MAG: ATP-binding protein [Firmicutes bacterium]|nr:ATP-binding protein [Bacillota bacterium]